MSQQYSNHRKFYPLHHFVFLPAIAAATAVGFYKAFTVHTDATIWLLFGISSFFTGLLAIMLRQHYALGNQDRIIRLEFRLRYFELMGHSAGEVEKSLTFGQIAALRFANDIAFKDLLKKAVEEKLSADDIKKGITDWQADYMRV